MQKPEPTWIDEEGALKILAAHEKAAASGEELYIPPGYQIVRPDPCPELTNPPAKETLLPDGKENG